VETPRAGLSGLTAGRRRRLCSPLLPCGSPKRNNAMEKPAILKATMAFVLGMGLAAALGLVYLSAWAWSTPEVSIWLKVVLPLLTVGILVLEVMLVLMLWRKAREQ
jgi:biotin transporter BioY